MNRARIHRLLESADPADRTGRIAGCAIAALILANVAALLLESTWPDDDALPPAFGWFEAISVVVFTVEYLLRLWSAPESPSFAGRFGRLRWICSPLALIDLLAIAPALAGLVLPSTLDLRALRALRLLRILRILRLGRYSIAMQAIAEAVREKRSELVSAVFVVLVMLVVASTLMFHVEHGPNGKSFPSIPAAMWWGIATLTTVGYGDVVPVTGLGKVLGAMIAILGIGVFALPAAILSSAFTERLSRHARPAAATRCPHCGKPVLADPPTGHDRAGEEPPHR